MAYIPYSTQNMIWSRLAFAFQVEHLFKKVFFQLFLMLFFASSGTQLSIQNLIDKKEYYLLQ